MNKSAGSLKPGPVLVICGILVAPRGAVYLGVWRTSWRRYRCVTAIVSGIGLIGFGRVIDFVEGVLKETRALRADLAAERAAPSTVFLT